MNNDLKSLPPPPKGQTGVTLEQFNHLPPPPTGRKGFTLEEIQSGADKKPLPTSSDNTNSTSFTKNFFTSEKDISTGEVKSVIKNLARPVSSFFQDLGYGVMARGKNFFASDQQHKQDIEDLKGKYGVANLNKGTPEYEETQKLLEPKNQGEKVGGVIETAAEFAAPFAGGENLAVKGSNALKSVKNFFSKSGEKELDDLVSATRGVADKKGRITTLEKTGATDTKGKPIGGAKQSVFGGVQTSATPEELSRAKSVQGVVKPNASPVDNLTSLNKEISRVSEKEVGPALKNAGPIKGISEKTPGWSKITQRLVDIEKPDIIKADATLDKTYDLVRQRMIEQIQKQPSTYEGLWDARKSFDKVVEDQFGDAAFNSEKNTAIKRAISDMRREVNKIIGEGVPEYKPQMDRLTDMYDARYNIAEQFQNLLDKGGWKAFKTLNPKKAATLKWGAGVAGLGAVEETVRRAIGD